jgi:uncharacterized membrane protein
MTLTAIALFVVVSGIVFLIADALMLGLVIAPIFRSHLGDTMLEGLRIGPAVAFYLLYMAGLTWFAGVPALRDADAMPALINGAILGLVAYGTYELTSWTVMRDWHPQMVITDMIWGAVLSGVSAYIGARVALAITS